MIDPTAAKHQREGSLGKVTASSLVKLLVLTILSEKGRPMYGAEIRQAIEDITRTEWRPSHDLLYNKVLKPLADNGFLVMEHKDPKGPGWGRIYWQLTDKGRRILELNKMEQASSIKDSRRLIDAVIEYVYHNHI